MVTTLLAAMLAFGTATIAVPGFVPHISPIIVSHETGTAPHPLHTSLTEILIEGTRITMRIRTYADDLDSALARSGVRVPASDDAIARYVMQRVGLSSGNGTAIPLEICGVQRIGDAVISCLHSVSAPRTALTIRNEMLVDLFSDQINIVQIKRGSLRRSMILTRAASRKAFD